MLNSRHAHWVAGLLFVGAAALVGCAKEDAAPPPVDASNADAWKQGLDEDRVAALSELPAEDREAALEQNICPVSGKPLGSMGKPIKVNVQGEDVFVCCDGCVDTVKENPDEYLAKLRQGE